LSADFAPHARAGVLPPKNDDLSIKDPLLVRFRKFEFMALGRFIDVVNLV
jgi:hypothetical protein